VKDGDTVQVIASKLNVKVKALMEANSLKESTPLKVGRTLRVPNAPIGKGDVVAVTKKKSSGIVAEKPKIREISYAVRNGDFDWAIAKKHGITVDQLYRFNPNVNWNALQVGQTLKLPTGGVSVVAEVKQGAPKPAKVSNAVDMNRVASYKVQKNENDWIIAHRLGTTLAVLKMLNPKTNLSLLQPGQSLYVPSSTVKGNSGNIAKNDPKVKAIRSRYAVVYGDAVTIRRGPKTTSEKVTVVDAGIRVAVLDREGSWYKLKFPKGTVGWVRGDLIREASAPAEVESSSRRRRRASYVASNGGSSNRSSNSERAGDDEVTAEVDGGDPAVSRALSMRGTRYSYGASSRSATDCSGFTLQVMRAKGVSLPRTSREQATVGAPVSKSELKKGDLVFFHTRSSSRINHVGMYLGNGKFIHASSGGGQVQINSLNDGYYSERFVTGRRVKK
jgi:cell wall-associated NlpC family hydrolase